MVEGLHLGQNGIADADERSVAHFHRSAGQASSEPLTSLFCDPGGTHCDNSTGTRQIALSATMKLPTFDGHLNLEQY